ncbi:tetratricopeptide repeat protein [Oscillatoria sp. FACHB-1407]|uniref:tetratricopeptide repeat protein n=1 Tax=Oscillatoria sp. FACHB-1407 TaxID=2692847 RepID=UPI001684DE20|nr:PLD nuclease N-terminal domain-containing protein [Oscillatoria sp. FACHB-1407]MBD2462757.1 tetratricopeptide repeat protein [Oscillatoria sp. FACHB-1407]
MIQVLAFVATGFWMLMIFDCVRNDPERNTWLFVLIFLNIPGAILYFLVRRLPYLNVPIPPYFQRWSRRQDLWNAEAAVRNIGKAHQYVTLGNVLNEMQMLDKAAEAYQQALEKEPKNTHALWGLASIAMHHQQFAIARDHLQQLLALEPDYKFGEASLAYGKALFALEDWDTVEPHLEKDLKHWGHPEACIMLAKIQINRGEVDAARTALENMIFKLKSAPKFHYRQKRHLIGEAERLLKKLRR